LENIKGILAGGSPFTYRWIWIVEGKMEIKVVFRTARCVAVEICDGSIYESAKEKEIYVNGEFYEFTRKVVVSIYGLKPDREYVVGVRMGDVNEEISVRTPKEFVTLNVKDFGAKGDGIQDDTPFIQAAILCCPKESRVLIPEGTYKVTSLFLKSNLRLELAEEAVLSAETDRGRFPVLRGLVESYDEKEEYNLGTWEGNPIDCFSSVITGIHVENVEIYGLGVIDGNASEDNWWHDPRAKKGAFRPRMIFLNHCRNVVVQGIQVQNSPSWNIHPYFSNHLKFVDISVLNPKDSPNTDGLDPESCRDVEVVGVYFSVGDDCIAVKSGKIYMGSKYKTPSENIVIRQCCMRDGHGSITIGSEMAGGVKKLAVRDCLFLHTDRGLRIKTRRGRGKDAVVDGILFENIRMDHVMTPFVINSFYYCDPDGHSDYVASKEALPVDDRTPCIKTLEFSNIQAENCHVAAAYLYGLPERKIERVEMNHVRVSYAANALPGEPAMLDGVEPVSRMGIFARNIETLVLEDVEIKGQKGEKIITENIEHLVEK